MSEKLKFDCGNRNEECDNATICPCLLFINKQLDSYEKVLQSDIFREATQEEQGDNMSLMTKEQYEDWINRLNLADRNIKPG